MEIPLRKGVERGKGLDAGKIGLGDVQRRLLPGEGGLCLVELDLKGLGVHFEEDLSCLDQCAFL